MVAKSDLIILSVATAVLAVGLFRWQQNSQFVDSRVSATATKILPSNSAPVNQQPMAQLVDTSSAISGSSIPSAAEDSATVSITSNGSSVNNGTLPTELQGATVIIEASGQDSLLNPIENNIIADTNSVLLMVHSVKPGEYLSLLAKRYGTTTEELTKLNGLTTTTLQIGQEIVYPSTQ